MEMERKCKKIKRQMEEKKMTIADFGEDELRCILTYVAISGPLNLMMALAACKLFSQIGNDRHVFLALDLSSRSIRIELTADNFKHHQQINGLISLAAQAGNLDGQVMFGKIIVMTCSQLMRPLYQKSFSLLNSMHKNMMSTATFKFDDFSTIEEDMRPDQTFMARLTSNEKDIQQAQSFMTQLNKNNNLYHYRFVRMLLSGCLSPQFFRTTCWDLSCYLAYHGKETEESLACLTKLWKMSKAFFLYRQNPMEKDDWYVHPPRPRTKVKMAVHYYSRPMTQFQEFLSQALLIFDKAFEFQELAK